MDEALERPTDLDEAAEYDRERWGQSPEALEQAALADELFPDTEE